MTLDPVQLVGEQHVETIVLAEHSRSRPVKLPRAARQALFAVADDRVRVLATADPDYVVLESTSWVGAISVPDLQVRITPNAPMASIFAMLGGLGDDIAWGESTSPFADDAELLDGSALVVLRAIEAATRRGLIHGYQTREENLSTIRGRLLVDQLARQPWTLSTPPCRYDEFTADVAENRLLRCAVRTIVGAHGLSPTTRRRAVELMARFEGVSDSGARDHADIPVTRLNEHYENAMGLARLALEGFAIRHEEGSREAHAFLVDIDTVFLRFVASELHTRLWPQQRVEQAEQLTLDDDSSLRATADILVRDASGPRLVIGTRYHLGESDAGSSPVAAGMSSRAAGWGGPLARTPLASVANDAASFFPVMVQAASLGLPNALIVYSHAARRPARRIKMPATGTTVHSWHVDLQRTWQQLSEDLDDLADLVRRLGVPE